MHSVMLFNMINDTLGNRFNIPMVDDKGSVVLTVAHTQDIQPTDDSGKDASFGQKTINAFTSKSEWIR